MYHQILKDIGAIVDVDQRATGYDYLKALAKNMAQTLGVKYLLIGRPVADNSSIETVVVWAGDDYAPNLTYELRGTPCREVFTGQRVCI
ncbi:MAG: hypothetical protein GWN58_46960, partial [Anaerolineae bacterium]|nr:hypothetical protein [Anaerolineae bacterium]